VVNDLGFGRRSSCKVQDGSFPVKKGKAGVWEENGEKDEREKVCERRWAKMGLTEPPERKKPPGIGRKATKGKD